MGNDKIGDTYTVYYNPNDPTDVLFKTPDRVMLITVCYLVSAAFVAGEICIIYQFIKQKKKT